MSNFKWDVIEGEICTELEAGKTKNEKQYYRFAVRTKKEIVKCVCWGGKFEGDTSCLSLGTKITARGFYAKQMDAFESLGDELNIKWFRKTNERPKTETFGNDASEFRRQRTESLKRNGFIEVSIGNKRNGVYAVKEISECIKDKGEYKHYIDYLCDHLGDGYVSGKFREFVRENKIEITKKESVSKSKDKYQAFISELRREADGKGNSKEDGQGRKSPTTRSISVGILGRDNGEEIDLDFI